MAYNGASTASDRLSRIRDTIEKVLNGAQEYYVGSRRTRYPSLQELYDMEQGLIEQVNAESVGNPLTVGSRVPAS